MITHRITRMGVSVSIALLSVWVVSSAVSVADAAEPVPSNLDLMTQLSTQVAEDIVGKIGQEIRGKRLRLAPSANSEEYQLLEDVFASILSEQGVTAVDASAKAVGAEEDDAFVLEYKVPVFRLTYPKVYRAYLIGGKKVEREANVRVSAKLLTGSGEVAWIGDASAEHADQFSHGDLGRIQEGAYQFVRPEMPSSGWGKVVEPVFVSAIIVGMIYLFFSNQSDS